MSSPLDNGESPRPVSSTWTFALPVIGFAIGVVGALCGIGGGLFATPLLNLGVGLPLPSAIATSLVLVFSTASSATVNEALSPDSVILWKLAFAVAAGAFVGARAGFKVVQRLGASKLTLIFGLFLVYAGVRMILPSSADDLLPPEQPLHWLQLAKAFGVGLLGGTVSPMMGIGGGVVMVPGLTLLLPELGFPAARAATLAAATVGASRGIFLYSKRRRVQWRYGLLLGAGAVMGATVGNQLTNLDGAASIGKQLLGVLVLFVSIRYLVGAWKEHAAKAVTG